MLRALKPDGKIAAVVYSTPENNKFFSIPVSIIRRPCLPPPLPGQPGPFSLGGDGVLEEAFDGPASGKCARSLCPRRHACPQLLSAFASSESRLGRSTRCSPVARVGTWGGLGGDRGEELRGFEWTDSRSVRDDRGGASSKAAD